MSYRFGKNPPKNDYRTLRLGDYLTAVLPPPPVRFSILPVVAQKLGLGIPTPANLALLYPLDGNDSIGNCVAEGTLVEGPTSPHIGYRIPYSGPVVTLITESGRCLTVTPNHAILTPGGFSLARLLQEGDYVVCGRFAEKFGRSTINSHFNRAPTPIEQVVTALDRISLSRGKERVAMPIAGDFHGDGRFVNGNVDVVGADSLLCCESNAALREPQSQSQIGSTGELHRALHGQSAPFEAIRSGRLAPFSRVGRVGENSLFRNRHSGVAKTDRLSQTTRFYSTRSQLALEEPATKPEDLTETFDSLSVEVSLRSVTHVPTRGLLEIVKGSLGIAHTPRWYASRSYPSNEGLPTDLQLTSELFSRFAGDISLDRVIHIRRREDFHGHVYDLSMDSNWYAADGIITHNCTIAALAHAVTTYEGMVAKREVMSEAAVRKLYFKLSGGVDSGLDMLAVLNYWQSHTIRVPSERLLAFVKVNPHNHAHVMQAIALFGGLYSGFQCQEHVLDEFDAHVPWQPGKLTNDGHAIFVTGYDSSGVEALTWGATQNGTWAWWDECVDEAYAILPIEAKKPTFEPGFNLAQLQADLAAVAG